MLVVHCKTKKNVIPDLTGSKGWVALRRSRIEEWTNTTTEQTMVRQYDTVALCLNYWNENELFELLWIIELLSWKETKGATQRCKTPAMREGEKNTEENS